MVYAAASTGPTLGDTLTIRQAGGDQPFDVKRLQQEFQLLKRQLTSKEQDIMELQTKVK